jgi:exopolysaccharide biosynthesis protein
LLCCLLLLPFLVSCSILPTVTIGSGSSSGSNTNTNVWNQVAHGVEVRREIWKSSSGDGASDTVTIARFDLQDVTLNVGYQPDQPLSMSEWVQKEHATALINGGYFNGQDQATALVVSNGTAYGTSYQGFGGMLDVDAQGNLQLRSLSQQPYSSSENLAQATQSSPMLMVDGQRTQFTADQQADPRSVVAVDKDGRLLFIVSPDPAFTLDDLADLLVHSDLSLENALNLDGGSSTGLAVNAGAQSVSLDSYVNLPVVIAVKER